MDGWPQPPEAGGGGEERVRVFAHSTLWHFQSGEAVLASGRESSPIRPSPPAPPAPWRRGRGRRVARPCRAPPGPRVRCYARAGDPCTPGRHRCARGRGCCAARVARAAAAGGRAGKRRHEYT
eukprot:scaffold3359_cov255-Prasinococcus_capsulatus_cf.AAC.1